MTSFAGIVFGQLAPDQELVITSRMPEHGVIFSDGNEADYLAYKAGLIAPVGLSERKVY